MLFAVPPLVHELENLSSDPRRKQQLRLCVPVVRAEYRHSLDLDTFLGKEQPILVRRSRNGKEGSMCRLCRGRGARDLAARGPMSYI